LYSFLTGPAIGDDACTGAGAGATGVAGAARTTGAFGGGVGTFESVIYIFYSPFRRYIFGMEYKSDV
jgi:hypothetical protein